jgi:hypothetical protein
MKWNIIKLKRVQLSCHAFPIVYIFLLLNYDKFLALTSFLLCEILIKCEIQLQVANCIKEKKERQLKICEKHRAFI